MKRRDRAHFDVQPRVAVRKQSLGGAMRKEARATLISARGLIFYAGDDQILP